MLSIRKSAERGHARHGWLESRHTFSFADYRDPRFMGFRQLRVLNEDRVQPGQGFGAHAHRDMEIVTWVLAGALEHKDSLGNGSIIHPGDVQRMSAGTGVTHSELNPSLTELVHFLQIWIVPERDGGAPSYEQKHFDAASRTGGLRLVASRDGRDGSVRLQQDASLYAALLPTGGRTRHQLAPGRGAWVQAARGTLDVNGISLAAGDGAALVDEPEITLTAHAPSEVLVFDLG